jgi:hypothetical protein
MKLCPWGKSNSARINSYKKQRLVKSFVFTWRLCDPVGKVRTLWWRVVIVNTFEDYVFNYGTPACSSN